MVDQHPSRGRKESATCAVCISDVAHRMRKVLELGVKGRCRIYGNALVQVDCGCITG